VEERLRDLEHHMLQVIDMNLELQKTINHQAKMIRLLSKVVAELGKAAKEPQAHCLEE
jgi:uncharacterized coiled-coil protein SlyX